MKIMYIDESGNHSLEKIDKNYPMFILAGVIIDYDDKDLIEKDFKDFKGDFFKTEEIILHTAEITRGINQYKILDDLNIRNKFYEKINHLMSKSPYKIVAVAIDQQKHKERYGNLAIGVYELSLHILVERFCFELSKNETGFIKCETRNEHLNNDIMIEWQRILNNGTRYIPAREIKRKIESFKLHNKKENIIGLQLADLVATPIGRYCLGKKTRQDFDIIKKKFRNKNGEFEKFGLIRLPKENEGKPAPQDYPPY